jgi:hypothetical protein
MAACNGICIFEPMEIPEFGYNDKSKHCTDTFGAGNDFEGEIKVSGIFISPHVVAPEQVRVLVLQRCVRRSPRIILTMHLPDEPENNYSHG